MNALHALHRLERNFKIVRLATHLRQRAGFDDAFRVRRQDAKGDFVIRQLAERSDLVAVEARKFFREIKSAIRRLADQQRLAQVHWRRLAVRAAKQNTHSAAKSKWP